MVAFGADSKLIKLIFLFLCLIAISIGCDPRKHGGESKEVIVRVSLVHIVQTAELIYSKTGRYPVSIKDMIDYKYDEEMGWDPPNMIDPWGQKYRYEIKNGKPIASCVSPDGKYFFEQP
jgi:hypothetical protein